MGYIYWNVRPELFHLGPFTVRWYGLFFGLLFFIGYLIARWQFRIEGKDERSLDSLLAYLVVGTIIGARLAHCFIYEPEYYLKHPLQILTVWKGGLASHGGAVGVLVSLGLYSRRHPDQPFLWLLDRISVPTALGSAMIRLGNLFNSEILGTPTDVPWAFIFARESTVPRHPAQLYESLGYFLIFVVLWLMYRRLRADTPRGLLIGILLAGVFIIRILVEFVKESQAAYEQGARLHVGQLLSVPFVVAGAILIWRSLRCEAREAQGSHSSPAAHGDSATKK